MWREWGPLPSFVGSPGPGLAGPVDPAGAALCPPALIAVDLSVSLLCRSRHLPAVPVRLLADPEGGAGALHQDLQPEGPGRDGGLPPPPHGESATPRPPRAPCQAQKNERLWRSLTRPRLHQAVKADLEVKRPAMDKLCSMSQDLLSSVKNKDVASKLEARLDHLAQRWDRLIQGLEVSSSQVSAQTQPGSGDETFPKLPNLPFYSLTV